MLALHHLALRTRDVERLVLFYRTWLSLDETRDARPGSVWLGLAHGAMLMIERAGDGEPAPLAGSLELIAFRVNAEQRALLRARLLAAGTLESETQHTLYFRDPDGRRVGVSTYAF